MPFARNYNWPMKTDKEFALDIREGSLSGGDASASRYYGG
jgi:hypothetical protein